MKSLNLRDIASGALVAGALAGCTVAEAPGIARRVDDHHNEGSIDAGADSGINVGGTADAGSDAASDAVASDIANEVGGNVQDAISGADASNNQDCIGISELNAVRLRDHQAALQAPSQAISYNYSSVFGLPSNYEYATFRVAELTSNTGIIQMHATDAQSNQVLGATLDYDSEEAEYLNARYTEHSDQAGSNDSVRFHGFEGVIPANTTPGADYKIVVSREGQNCFVQEGTNQPEELCAEQCNTIFANVEAVLR